MKKIIIITILILTISLSFSTYFFKTFDIVKGLYGYFKIDSSDFYNISTNLIMTNQENKDHYLDSIIEFYKEQGIEFEIKNNEYKSSEIVIIVSEHSLLFKQYFLIEFDII